MLIVLSDLHFSEAQSTQLGSVKFNRNLPADTYQAYFADMNQVAIDNGIPRVNIVLAGDIFELSRTAFWLDGMDRPYLDNSDISSGSSAEKTLLRIIKAIHNEEKVAETLALFRNIQDYFDCEVNAHFILGNHDRLANATPAIRNEVRCALGLEGGEGLFDHQYIFRDHQRQPFCLVRHGHEYDPMNFSINTHDMDEIPTKFSESAYGEACLGDVTTLEFGAALPRYFVEIYGEEAILSDDALMALYERLMDFDDVRPTTALLAYLFSTPDVKKEKTWELMEPCFTKAINALSDNQFFLDFLRHSSSLEKSQRILLKGFLESGFFTKNIPYWMMKQLMKRVSKTIKLKSQIKWAKREELIRDKDSGCRCVISGHTHFPEVSLISAKKGRQRYYINTGTWRNMIPATKNFRDFGLLKAMTKVMVFQPLENPESDGDSSWSFQYLSGVSYGDHRHL